MSDFNRGFAGGAVQADMSVDAGLRSYMLGVYNKVALGLVLSAVLAYVTGNVMAVRELLFSVDSVGRSSYTLLGMVLAFAPLGILLFQGFARRQSPQSAAFTYWAVVSLIGASLGVVFIRYSGVAIFQTFLITACAFAGLSLVGYTTKRDLSGMGNFLIMGLIGLILASVLAMFLQSPMMTFIINLAGVGIFAGFIAYDTQNMKATYYHLGGEQTALSVATSYAALNLYLDFINLFRFLLYFVGGGRR